RRVRVHARAAEEGARGDRDAAGDQEHAGGGGRRVVNHDGDAPVRAGEPMTEGLPVDQQERFGQWKRDRGKKREDEANALKAIPARHEELLQLLAECSGKWGYEDPVYRFYHQSLKVYYVQESTQKIVDTLQSLAPHLPLNTWFLDIVRQGTGREFSLEDNNNW